jgi:transcriptional regulator with XRE-family HTH domain
MMTTLKLNSKMITIARESRGLSQLELAEKLSVSTSHMSRIEQDFIEVGEHHLKSISAVLNYPEEFFIKKEKHSHLPSHCASAIL